MLFLFLEDMKTEKAAKLINASSWHRRRAAQIVGGVGEKIRRPSIVADNSWAPPPNSSG